MKTLLLVDGSSYLYRAFHALPDLRNRHGEPTGAIYGVLNMLRRLHTDYHADYSACVFDAKGKTFRDDWYPEYKANRPSMPDDLARQIEPLHRAIAAMGWPLLCVDGVEADDVIGTLTVRAAGLGVRSVVSSGDKDLVQLVNDHVTLVNTMSNETLDEAAVLAKYGVTAGQFLDYLTLIGDAVDNVPGVEKVGPKTAAKWIAQYGSLDNVLANAGAIGGVVGENLRRVVEWLPQARRLLTVRLDLELPVALDDLVARERDRGALLELFERFEFKTWRRELQAQADAGAPAPAGGETADGDAAPLVSAEPAPRDPPPRYDLVLTPAELDAWVERLGRAGLVAIGVEVAQEEPLQARPVGIALSDGPGQGAYVPFAHRAPGVAEQLDAATVLARLAPVLSDPARPKLGRQLKFQKHALANVGIDLAGCAHDVELQSYVLEAHRPHPLEALALRHLEFHVLSREDVTGKGAARIGFDEVELERATQCAAGQVDAAHRLHAHLFPGIAAEPGLLRVYETIEMPVLEVLFAMERTGVLIDAALLERQSHELGERMLEIEQRAYEAAGQPFNLNSPKQIQEILFTQQQLPVLKKTPGGTPSTDEDVLQQLALDYPLPKHILAYRSLSKLKSTYTDKLPRMVNATTGRVHTTYAQAVAVTGRLASLEPNLQNIPIRTAAGRRIREAFVAPPGAHIVSADYSQIELRIMAHLSGDANLLSAFAQGRDVHQATAAEVFGLALDAVSAEQRRYAKAINFGLIYGMSAFGLAAQLGIERSAAQAYIDRYFARYPGVADYMQRTREQARSQGFVETVFGRRLWLPEIASGSPGRRQGAERAAINAPMQGTAADLVKLAMIAVQGWLLRDRLASRLVMQVHDELVLEVPDGELAVVRAELPRLMGGVADLAVPLLVETGAGPNWDKAH